MYNSLNTSPLFVYATKLTIGQKRGYTVGALYTGNSEDPDEIQHHAAFHKALHFFSYI